MPQVEESASPDVLSIRALQQRALTAIEAADVDAYVACFAEGGMSMPPGQQIVRGRQAIREWIGALFQRFHVKVEVWPQELHIVGDWAIDRHNYLLTATPTLGGPTVKEGGKGVIIAKRSEDGSWEWYIDCWNSDSLPPPQ